MSASTPAASTPWSLRANCLKFDDSIATTPCTECTRLSEIRAAKRIRRASEASGAVARARERATLLVEVVAELLRTRRMAQLRQGLGLDLSDSLACDAELLADLLQRARMSVRQ